MPTFFKVEATEWVNLEEIASVKVGTLASVMTAGLLNPIQGNTDLLSRPAVGIWTSAGRFHWVIGRAAVQLLELLRIENLDDIDREAFRRVTMNS